MRSFRGRWITLMHMRFWHIILTGEKGSAAAVVVTANVTSEEEETWLPVLRERVIQHVRPFRALHILFSHTCDVCTSELARTLKVLQTRTLFSSLSVART